MDSSRFTRRLCPGTRLKKGSDQKGTALVVSLLFLVILSLIAVSSISTATLEERMARNSRDQNIAFQAAEAALKDAETDIAGVATTRVPVISPGAFAGIAAGDCSATGLCTPAAAGNNVWEGSPSRLEDTAKSIAYSNYTASQTLPITGNGAVSQQPRYVIEYLGAVGIQSLYRVTVVGYGGVATTKVILQSEVLK